MNECPLCQAQLVCQPERYTQAEIRGLWSVAGQSLSADALSSDKAIDSVTLFECPECRLGLFLPIWVGSSKFYDELSISHAYYLEDKWEFREAAKDLRGADIILEVGCGNGSFLMPLISQGKQAMGLELSPEAAASARSRGINVECEMLESVAVRMPGKFDAVCAFQVLEHVAEPDRYLSDIARLLRPHGLAILAVPNAEGILRFLRPVPTDVPPHHLTRWAGQTFNDLSRFGFKTIKIRYEPLDAPRFHWLIARWDRLTRGHWEGEDSPWKRAFKYQFWIWGRRVHHYGVLALKRIGIKTLPWIRGHTLYVVLKRA